MPDLIPSLDGDIYHWDGSKLDPFPFTADDLIDHTHVHKGRGSFLAGAKTIDVVGIDIKTGKVMGVIMWVWLTDFLCCSLFMSALNRSVFAMTIGL